MSSYLKILDLGIRSLLYTKFADILNLESIAQGVLFYPKGVSQREISERRGNAELEFISAWRTEIGLNWERANTPLARRGVWMPYDDSTVNVKTIPIKTSYKIHFWSKDRDTLNEIAERYLFWIQDDPNLNLTYMDTYPLDFDLHFGEIFDESVIESKYETGMYHVYSADISLDGWVFTSSDPTNNLIYTIKIACYDRDDLSADTSPTYEEVYVEDSNQDTELETTLKLFSRTITS